MRGSLPPAELEPLLPTLRLGGCGRAGDQLRQLLDAAHNGTLKVVTHTSMYEDAPAICSRAIVVARYFTVTLPPFGG
jgi:hypothetical protein